MITCFQKSIALLGLPLRLGPRLRNIYLTFESYTTATVNSKQIIERNMSGDYHKDIAMSLAWEPPRE